MFEERASRQAAKAQRGIHFFAGQFWNVILQFGNQAFYAVFFVGKRAGGTLFLRGGQRNASEPNLFAAAIPVCGRGQTDLAKKIVHLPIWIFHGELDRVVPTQHSRDMVAALKKAGGKPTHTEYAGVRHNSWTPAYADKKLWTWLFAQKKKPETKKK